MPVLGKQSGLAIPAKSSVMVWTRLRGLVLMGVTDTQIPHRTAQAKEPEHPADGTRRFSEVKYLAGKFSDAVS